MISPKDNSMEVIAKGLAEFFVNDPEKVTRWLFTNNPNFGGIAPADLIVRQRGFKVAQFIIDARSQAVPWEAFHGRADAKTKT